MLNKQLQAALDRRRQRGTLRSLTDYETVTSIIPPTATPEVSPNLPSALTPSSSSRHSLIDFSSNDYMGLGQSSEMRGRLLERLQKSKRYPLGSTGSRLLDGNSSQHEQLERRLADQLGAPCALLFNSGFDANTSLLSTLPQPKDYILFDALIHASAHDGMRASRTSPQNRIAFYHNDLDHLSQIINHIQSQSSSNSSNIFIVAEAVYSMDGDLCPLQNLVDLIDQKITREKRCIIIDEAHAVGLYGLKGAGLADEVGVRDSIDIRLATFGKAFGSSGAAVLCSPLVRQFLINYARPLIYSTAMPYTTLASVECALDILASPNGTLRATKTFSLTQMLLSGIQQILALQQEPHLSLPLEGLIPSLKADETLPLAPIIPLVSSNPRNLANHLIKRGYLVRAIVYPTVPKGSERVRICIHSHNKAEDVKGLLASIQEWSNEQQGQWKVKM